MSHGSPAETLTPCGIEDVPSEMMRLIDRCGEVDLATIYRSMVNLYGTEAVPTVSETLGRLVRDGKIEIETRNRGPFEALVGYARLTPRSKLKHR